MKGLFRVYSKVQGVQGAAVQKPLALWTISSVHNVYVSLYKISQLATKDNRLPCPAYK